MEFAASVIAVAQLTGACLRLARKWLGPSAFSTAELRSIMADLYAFAGVMHSFRTHLEVYDDDEARLVSLQHLAPVLESCGEALEAIKKFLDESGTVGRHLLGARFDRKLGVSLKVLDGAKEIFMVAVHADHQTILARVEGYLRNVREDIQELHSLAVETKQNLDQLIRDQQTRFRRADAWIDQEEARERREERRAVLDWLTKLDYGPQYHDYLDKRQPGTGQWLLNSAEYTAWVAAGHPTLFCQGIAGSGKTMLTAIVIEDLEKRFQDDPSVAVGYLYFNFKRQFEQAPRELLASLLKQLAQRQHAIPGSVRVLYDKHQPAGATPKINEVSSALQEVASVFRRVFVVVDALDECQAEDQCRETFLREISELQEKANVSCFFTSRHIPDIEEAFAECPSLEISAANEDIDLYLEGHMNELPRFVRESQNLRDKIKREIIAAVDGMFLLAHLYLRALEDKTTVKAVKTTLSQFQRQTPGSTEDAKARTLADAYDQAMVRIQAQRAGFRQLAEKVLAWIAFVKVPLKTTELQHALAVEIGELQLDEENIPPLEQMISVCSGLVTIDKQSKVVRLIHYTAQEYLSQTKDRWFPAAEADICITCATYLSYDVFSSGFCDDDTEYRQRLESYHLYAYAARHWALHASCSNDPLGVQTAPAVLAFLERTPNVEATFQAFSARPYITYWAKATTGLHLAAYWDLHGAVGALLARGHDPTVQSWRGWTPLGYALAGSAHEPSLTVDLLLSDGRVAVKESDNGVGGKTPLMHATFLGRAGAVELFLKLGVDRVEVVARAASGKTALLLTTKYRTWNGSGNLLDNGRARDGHGWTVLAFATRNNRVRIMERLLANHGIDAASEDYGGLLLAAALGYERIVTLARKWLRPRRKAINPGPPGVVNETRSS